MNEGQIKIRILLIQVFDWSLLIAVFSIGIFGVLYSEYKALMATIALLGLGLVNWSGHITIHKIASLRAEIGKLQSKHKK